MQPKEIVVSVNVHDDKAKRKAMKAVSCLQGINAIKMDMKGSKMTVIGDVDPIQVVAKLKKHWCPEILTVGPVKEEKKDDKKDDKKDEKKDKDKTMNLIWHPYYNNPIPSYFPPPNYDHYDVHSIEENPTSCSIC